jgi:hypothetical protein
MPVHSNPFAGSRFERMVPLSECWAPAGRTLMSRQVGCERFSPTYSAVCLSAFFIAPIRRRCTSSPMALPS